MSASTIPTRVYLIVFAALLGLTLLTVAVASIDLGVANVVVAISIAAIKGTLVVLYFMHVRYASRLVWVFAGAGFVWLILLIGLTMGDVLTRDWTAPDRSIAADTTGTP